MTDKSDVPSAYSSRAEVYQQHRWPFDTAVVATLLERTGLTDGGVVADIGAGTGLSSRPFLEAGCTVYAVEPSAGMRRVAEEEFAGFERYHNINGRAEDTGLPPDFAELIVAGRALHWFPQAAAREEFRRIARPDGWLAVLSVTNENVALVAERRRLYFDADTAPGLYDRARLASEPLSYFFRDGRYEELTGAGLVTESWPAFLGRLCSLTTTPQKDEARFERFEQEARALFDRYQENGILTIPTMTRIKYGRPR